jgi:hypothetical protein
MERRVGIEPAGARSSQQSAGRQPSLQHGDWADLQLRLLR